MRNNHNSGRNIRLGLVGLGKMGLLHWRTWQRLPDVSVTAAADTDPAKALWAKAQGVPFFRKNEDLIGQVDAVIIATPIDQHISCALPFLVAGIPCLIEKPIALSFTDSQHLVSVAARHGALLAVGHSERFNPALQQVRNPNGSSPSIMEVFRMATMGNSRDPYADVVQDLMVHDLDWVLDVMGQSPTNFRVRDARWMNNSLSHVCCELHFAQGTQIVLTADCMAASRRREVILHGAVGTTRSIGLDVAMNSASDDPLTCQARAFLAALQGKPSPIATGEEALRVMTMVEQIRTRCKNTHAVTL